MGFAGIDLGNSRVKVAVPDSQGNPVMQPNNLGELYTPSAVYFDKGKVIVGSEALNAGLLEPSRLVVNWKRSMGSDEVLCKADKKEYRAKDIARILLAHVAENFTQKTGEVLSQAAISVPANYNDRQKAETKEAAEKAGISVVSLPHEPTAAIFGNRVQARGDGVVAILDLGGGTFDVSLVRVSGNTLEVIATNGEAHLGGQDFNERLLALVLERFAAQHSLMPTAKSHPLEFYQLCQQVENAKLTLSARDGATLVATFGGKVAAIPITRAELAAKCSDLLDIALKRAQQTLDDASVKAGDVKDILPVGGASQMPCFLEAIAGRLGRKPSVVTEPFYAVALGAMTMGRLAIEQEGAFHSGGRALPSLEYRLTDVTAHPIGVAALDDNEILVNSVILKKGMPIPSDHVMGFKLAAPGQVSARIQLFQGADGVPVTSCQAIGEFHLTDLQPVHDRPHRIDVRLRIDRNGMLTAAAHDPLDGKQAELEIDYSSKRKVA